MKPHTPQTIKVVDTDLSSLSTPVGEINIPLPMITPNLNHESIKNDSCNNVDQFFLYLIFKFYIYMRRTASLRPMTRFNLISPFSDILYLI
jgi:hypothetical protein